MHLSPPGLRAGLLKTVLIAAFFATLLCHHASAYSMTDSNWGAGKFQYTLGNSGYLELDYDFGTGKSGKFTGTSIDTYFWKVDYISGSRIGLTQAPAQLASGDRILLVNLQGTPSNFGSVGNYELLRVVNVTGASVYCSNITKSYGDPNTQKIYIQKVPQYTDATIAGGINGTRWGSEGTGIIAFMVSGTLTFNNGLINATGLGFSGGSADSIPGFQEQGDSISGSGARSRSANKGGGGGGYATNANSNQTGGGGGGFRAAGADGKGIADYAGVGGETVYSQSRIRLGSGGGAGGVYLGASPACGGSDKGGAGGRGGGSIVIYARTIAGIGAIETRGNAGLDGTGNCGCGGGGGSGGQILMTSLALLPDSVSTDTDGRKGGKSTMSCDGGAGGGGGSRSALNTNPVRFNSGTYWSVVLDSTKSQVLWKNMTITLAAPLSGSDITAYYKACFYSDCSDIASYSKCGGKFTSGDALQCNTGSYTAGRYFQYSLVINTANASSTPSVKSVRMEYVLSDDAPPLVGLIRLGTKTGWVNTDLTGRINCTDMETACDASTYAFKKYLSSPPPACPADYSQYQPTDPVSSNLNVDSLAWVCAAAKDKAGNAGYTPAALNFSIDKDPPLAEVKGVSSSKWVKSINLTLGCTDLLSGCGSSMYYKFVSSATSDCPTGGTWTNSTLLNVIADRNIFLCLRVLDRAGNNGTDVSPRLYVDATSPSTSDDADPAIWYGSPAEITLSCSDALSGCNRTFYCIANESGICTPSSFRMTANETILNLTCGKDSTCQKVVRYYSRDNAVNNEVAKVSAIIKLDTTVPTCRITSPSGPYATANITVSWNASSSGQIAGVEVQKRESNGTVEGAFEDWISQPGAKGSRAIAGQNGVKYSFRCRAENQLGAKGPYSASVSATVDTGLPTAKITVPGAFVNASAFLVSWSGSDAETGISEYYVSYRNGSGAFIYWNLQNPLADSATFGKEGGTQPAENNKTYTFRVQVTDKAGNIKNSSQVSVKVDLNKPNCTIQSLPAYQTSAKFTLSWSGIEGESGIREFLVEQKAGSGNWTLLYRGENTSKAISNAKDGAYSFRCKAYDNANNTGPVSSKSTTVDAHPPAVQIAYNGSADASKSLVINATISDTIRVSSVTLSYGNKTINETNVTRNDNLSVWEMTWVISSPLPLGLNTFRLDVKDISGNSNVTLYQFTASLCNEGEVRPCGACGSGNRTCAGGNWSAACAGEDKSLLKPEVCNGQDDNCNGIIDDVAAGDSIEATACRCYNVGIEGVQSESAASNLCNGIDDDCDGDVDEGGNCCEEGTTQDCGMDIGKCAFGAKTCAMGKFGPCVGGVNPDPAETCGNKVDDDCDGVADEECEVCADSDKDGNGYPGSNACNYPDEDCDDSDASIFPGAKEVCNGKDDDCDGQVDEGVNCNHCGDGEQNGDEEGIDCGGADCPACFVWGWLFLTAGGAVILLILAFLWMHFKRQGRELSWEELKKKWTPEGG